MSNGQLKYAPAADFVGEDTMTYRSCDSLGACDSAQLKVIILLDATGIQAPVLTDDEAEMSAAESVDVYVLDNDVDPDGTFLSIKYACEPRHGNAEIMSGGRIRYRPASDFSGIDTFCYVACDEDQLCAAALVSVTVPEPPNLPPAALDDFVSTPKGVPVTLRPLDNDIDPNEDPLVLWTVGSPPNGRASASGNELTFTPSPDFVGEVWFTVTISDGRGGLAESYVIVLVLPDTNLPPTAADDRRAASLVAPTDLMVRANDTDPEDDALTITWVSYPRSATVSADLGVVSRGPDGDLVFTPGPELQGLALVASPLRFDYEVTDLRGGVSRAEVIIDFLDRDGDRIPDDIEIGLLTDPGDADTDDDGIDDGDEIASGDPTRYDDGEETNPLDADTDDDGLKDGEEARGTGVLDGRTTDPMECDTDDDNLCDGLEVGLTSPVPPGISSEGNPYIGTDLARWAPDLDPASVTEPLDDDTDDDGRLDGNEDEDVNGRWDGKLGGTETRGEGETDPNLADTDGDGLKDGTEVGLIGPEGQHTNPILFVPDRDPVTTTDPRDDDTDDGSVKDGVEDSDLDGAVDEGERDPNFKDDDVLSDLDDLRVFGSGGCANGAPMFSSLLVLAVLCVFLQSVRKRGVTTR